MLRPEVQERLSAGGRRLARAVNGLETAPAPRPRPVTARPPAPLAAPAARQNVRVNDPSMDEVGHTNSESSVTISGANIVVGFNDASADGSGWAVSTDGGASFAHHRLPQATGARNFGDPVLATGPNGEVYYGTLMTVGSGSVSTIGVAKSTDGGLTFGAPVSVASSVANGVDTQDKSWVAVDASPTSKYKGYVYASWTDFLSTGETAILLTRSSDGGGTWESAVQLSPFDTVGVQNSTVAVAPNGDLYVAFEDGHVSPDAITLWKSTDAGSTWASTTVVAFQPLNLLTGGGGVRASSYPCLAVDAQNRVHVVVAAPDANATVDRSDVFYLRSTDGGVHFADAVKLNDDGTPTTQAFPSLAVAPDGTVAVKWTDRRSDPANDALTGVTMRLSKDGGATFGASFRLSDTTWAYGPVETDLGAGYHGDYDGLAYANGTFWATWSDERGSDPDVYAAPVPAGFDAATPDADVAAGTPFLALKAGTSGGIDLTTKGSNGFAGTLTLSASPAIAGISYAFAKSAVAAGESARLTIAAASSAAAGDYHVTISASAGGLVRATTVRLTVTAATSAVDPPRNLTASAGFTGTGGVKSDGAGRLHLLYEDDTAAVLGEDVFYRRSTDGGVTWSSPLRLNGAGAYGVDTVLATDASGRVVAAWVGQGPDDGAPRVFVARSTDGGATFGAAGAITPTNQIATNPAVALDGVGNVLVAYFDSGSGALATTRSVNGGAFDTPAATGADSAASITRPALAIDAKGVAYLGYTREVISGSSLAATARIVVAKDGRAFGAPVSIAPSVTTGTYAPDFAVAPDGTLVAAFYERVVSSSGEVNREVFVARSADGATFSAPVQVAQNTGQSYFPSVTVETSGAIDVAWEDDTGNFQTDAFFARSTDGGATFSAPVNLSANLGLSGSAANPLEDRGGSGRVAVSASTDGVVYVSWLDDSPANPDVFFSAVRPSVFVNHPPTASVTAPAPGLTVEAGVPVAFAGSGTDPDGDALTYAWTFGDGTAAAGAAPAHPFANPGTYTATLTVTDARGASASASVTVTVVAPTLTGTTLLVPVVLDTAGLAGSHYTSELTLASRESAPVDVLLRYTASQGGGSGVARLTLGAGEQRVIPSVIELLRARSLPIPADGARIGTLLVTFGGVTAASHVFAGARTFTRDPNGGAGTFGLFYAAAETTTGTATLVGLQQNDAQRSNVAVVNGGADPIAVRVSLFGEDGAFLGSFDESLGAYGWTQINEPLAGKAASGRAVVTPLSGTSPFTAYAVRNDAVTSDGSFIPPLLGGDASGADRLVPIVLDAQGLGARFRTELTLTNLTGSSLPLTLVYTAAPGFGSGSGNVGLTLDPNEQRTIPDAISFLRVVLPIENDGRSVAGTLLVKANAGLPASALAVGARTFVPLAPSGSYGLFYPGLTSGECASGVAFVFGLAENTSERSNLALVNRGDAGAITLRVTFTSSTGAALGAPQDVALAPGEWRQLNRPLAALGASSAVAKIEKISGSSRFAAYGVLNDNVSSDGSYVPMVIGP